MSYSLALGLPWVGKLVNGWPHDNVDYTKYLGLCQPFCGHDLNGFDELQVNISLSDLDDCNKPGTFKLPGNLTRPTVLLISEDIRGEEGFFRDLDEGHTQCLVRLRDRFVDNSLRFLRCPRKKYLVFHFRWGDVNTSDYDNVDDRSLNMSRAVVLINKVLQLCDLDVKVMSEGKGVGGAFAKRFGGDFQYIDGYQSALAYDLLTFACSSVLIGGKSSFSVLGALLSPHRLVLAPTLNVKYQGLDHVLDWSNVSMPVLEDALRRAAPGSCSNS